MLQRPSDCPGISLSEHEAGLECISRTGVTYSFETFEEKLYESCEDSSLEGYRLCSRHLDFEKQRIVKCFQKVDLKTSLATDRPDHLVAVNFNHLGFALGIEH